MERRLGKPTQMPTGKELTEALQRKFERDVLPELLKNERWRNSSRYADIRTCLPGGCPKFPISWPK